MSEKRTEYCPFREISPWKRSRDILIFPHAFSPHGVTVTHASSNSRPSPTRLDAAAAAVERPPQNRYLHTSVPSSPLSQQHTGPVREEEQHGTGCIIIKGFTWLPKETVNGFLSVFHFLALIRATKTPFFGHFVRYCGVFWAAQNHDTKGDAKSLLRHLLRHLFCSFLRHLKTPQNLTKCRVCGVFAARICQKKLRKHQKSVFLRLPFVGLDTWRQKDGAGEFRRDRKRQVPKEEKSVPCMVSGGTKNRGRGDEHICVVAINLCIENHCWG